MEKVCFETMSDDGVLERVEALVARSNELTAELLVYLAEVDRRGLYLREACGSLFAFCVERLHMSESAAGKRITAARVARRFPLVLQMVARGEIHLTAVNMLAAHLTEENHAEVLAKARHRSKREIEKLVAEIAPKRDVSSRVVALRHRAERRAPERAACPAESVARAPERAARGPEGVACSPEGVACSPEGVACSPEGVACSPEGAARGPERVGRGPKRFAPNAIAPLAPRRYLIRVTVGEETHAALSQLQDLLSHQVPDRDPALIIARALALLLERTLARKAAVVERPRKGNAPERRTRPIPAAVRRAVWTRDGARCAFVDERGRRCSSTRFLEFHHLRNWARGAEHRPDEIELRCRGHNHYQAVLDYGADFMARCRPTGPSRAEEPREAFRHRSSVVRYSVGMRAAADHDRDVIPQSARAQPDQLEEGGPPHSPGGAPRHFLWGARSAGRTSCAACCRSGRWRCSEHHACSSKLCPISDDHVGACHIHLVDSGSSWDGCDREVTNGRS